MAGKTNAVRIAQKAGIHLEEAFYTYDESDLSGIHAAQSLGLAPQRVFKTLVAYGERTGVNVFCIPVCRELDLKKAAKAAADKSISLVPVKQLLSLTGYIRGGCSPIGMKKKYATYLDASCMQFNTIAVSAGERGHQMLLAPSDLAALTQATLCDIVNNAEKE